MVAGGWEPPPILWMISAGLLAVLAASVCAPVGVICGGGGQLTEDNRLGFSRGREHHN